MTDSRMTCNSQHHTMDWCQLISDKRLGMEEYHDPRKHTRTDFRRDFDRLVFSSPFRRLQNKTQVFPLPGSIFVHNRLTHSLEVSSVGRSMAAEIAVILKQRYTDKEVVSKLEHISDIVATACLSHDLGNPPFGHSGEKTISTFFSEGEGEKLKTHLSDNEWADLIHFEGNANSFRVLTHQFCGRRPGGFAMTYSTLASIVKYPFSSLNASEKGKFGYFKSEEETWRKVVAELGIPELYHGKFARHPLVYIVEGADDICYQIMDIEDAHKLKILTTNTVKDLFLTFFPDSEKDHRLSSMKRLTDPNEQIAYLRSSIIGLLVEKCAEIFANKEQEILNGDFSGSLIMHLEGDAAEGYKTLFRHCIQKNLLRSGCCRYRDSRQSHNHVINALSN